MTDPVCPPGAIRIAGGWTWFDRAEARAPGADRGQGVAASALPAALRARIAAPRATVCGLALDRPRIMGILNTTPDSFSDGGRHLDPARAVARGLALADAGADILDIGGESTRPGATEVPAEIEIARTAPVIAALRAAGLTVPLSIDTRKAAVAAAALAAGADMVNDVSALAHDPDMGAVVAAADVPVCLMHARGTPATMQDDPQYDDVVAEVCDELAARRDAAIAAGIAPGRIVLDPGIGFGKTAAHNLAILRALTVFHGLGTPILLGASRKRFIGTIGGEIDTAGADAPRLDGRAPGSIAVALAALAQGVQILRVHDVAETRQAMRLWQALNGCNDGEGNHD